MSRAECNQYNAESPFDPNAQGGAHEYLKEQLRDAKQIAAEYAMENRKLNENLKNICDRLQTMQDDEKMRLHPSARAIMVMYSQADRKPDKHQKNAQQIAAQGIIALKVSTFIVF